MLLACGACSDALFESRHWWIAVVPKVFLALLVEGAVFALITWGMKLESASPRGRAAALAGLLFTLCSPMLGIGNCLALALLVLVPAAGWSLFRNFRFSPALSVVRVAIVVVGVVAGVWHAWPSHRDVDGLLEVAITASRLRMVDSWIVDELRRRPEAVSALESRVSESPEASMLELHAALGGPAEFRRPHCEQLQRKRPKDQEVARICTP